MNLANKKFGRLTCLYPSEKKRYWICIYECGNQKEIRDNHLTMGKIITCSECPIFELPGKKIGKLTVIEYISGSGGKNIHRKFRCLCECGNETYSNSTQLLRNEISSCGKCINRNLHLNKEFGYLRVLSYYCSDSKGNSSWLCQCKCGIQKIIKGHSLTSGYVQSCGCKIFVEGSRQGENGGRNILTEKQVIQIRKLWAQELVNRAASGERKVRYSMQDLADKYHVSHVCIFKVINSQTWFFLPPMINFIKKSTKAKSKI